MGSAFWTVQQLQGWPECANISGAAHCRAAQDVAENGTAHVSTTPCGTRGVGTTV